MKQWIVVVASVALFAPAALAAPGGKVADVQYDTQGAYWRVVGAHEAVVLTVGTPWGVIERVYGAGEDPSFSLDEVAPDSPDGAYTWQVRISPVIPAEVRKELARSRATGDAEIVNGLRRKGLLPQGPLVESGSFAVIDGVVVPPGAEEEPRGAKGGATAAATAGAGGVEVVTAPDQVIPDDLIVQGSLCVGFDCINNESFGFDTIRLKENNTRVKFEDTSSTTGFPSSDWQLTANDSASGGLNKFSIEDITGARVPFTIEGGSTTNSIYVDSTGRVGFRTATPVLDLHVSTSNTPGIRLEQTSAGGFTAQTWDIAGNEANFFVRDVTGGSRLPFRIRPGAPTSSIDISAAGNVGIGTASPNVDLHILKTAEAATDVQFKIEANTDPAFDFAEQDSGVTWRFINNNTVLKIADVGTGADGAEELTFNQAGDLTITGEIFTSGSCLGGCDLVFSPDYELPSIEEHAEAMFTNRHLPSIGPTPENGPFNLSRMAGGMLNELEKAHIYIEQLHGRLARQEQENTELAQRLEAIEAVLQAQAENQQ